MIKTETVMLLNEERFMNLLPDELKVKDKRFFTPAEIAIKSAIWLSGKDKRKILDIGAGVGKFCAFAGKYTNSKIIGIEMRPQLVTIAMQMLKVFKIRNAKVLHGNITDFEFSDFDAFYIYNPFHENIVQHLRMDDSILLSQDFYSAYVHHTLTQLSKAKAGTRLVTYHGNNYEVPGSYVVVEEHKGGELKFWVKEK